jgi:hypothetical protein
MRNLLVCFLFAVGCQPISDQHSTGIEISLLSVPRITRLKPLAEAVIKLQLVDSITQVWPSFIGRFPFAPHLAVEKADSLGERDFLSGPYYQALEGADSLSTDGLEVLTDYTQDLLHVPSGDSLAHHTYPVCVANATPRTKLFYGFSSGVYAIQEARDREGHWRPIERKGREWCGNGAWALKLRPHELIVFVMSKYAGDFHTLLRIRLQNGASRYVSAPYAGTINERQFLVPTQEYAALAYDLATVNYLYNGALPAAVDSIRHRRWRKEAASPTP